MGQTALAHCREQDGDVRELTAWSCLALQSHPAHVSNGAKALRAPHVLHSEALSGDLRSSHHALSSHWGDVWVCSFHPPSLNRVAASGSAPNSGLFQKDIALERISLASCCFHFATGLRVNR